MKKAILLSIFLLISLNLLAVNIKGTIKNAKAEILPFTSIIVKGTSTGTMTNANGEYLITLQSGSYELVFQYLGYKTFTKKITLEKNDITLNVILEEEIINLGEINVKSGNEDPPIQLCEKPSQKAKIHHLQVTSYTATAYIKNTILLNNAPFFIKKQMEKEGVKIGVPFISESVLEIGFKQPNSRFTKVISKKSSSIDNNITISDDFYLLDFYNPVVGNESISPLSPKAFSYYNFEYAGFFEDRGVTVNKIRVIPKISGSGVWQGTIYIIDNYWNIHSIDVETFQSGFNYKIYQVYAPIQQVWIPVNQRVLMSGSFLGFDFSVKSQVNPSFKSVVTNPAFVEEIKIIDEKVEGKKQKSLTNDDFKKKNSTEILNSQKQFSLKELNRLMKEHEKEENSRRKANKEEVSAIRNDSVAVDSMATKRTAEYWNNVRSIPLTTDEVKGYHFTDSIKVAKNEKKDSLKADSARKSWRRFLTGADFNLKNGLKLKYEPPYMPLFGLNYNTVEGVVANLGLTLHKDLDKKKPNELQYQISTDLRYGFGNKLFLGRIGANFKQKANSFEISGGKYKALFDAESGLPDWLNTITTMLSYNIGKYYQKDYLKIGYTYEADRRLKWSNVLEFAKRTEWSNLPDDKLLFQRTDSKFASNSPTNLALGNTDFPTHNALIYNTLLTWRPNLSYRIYNGKKIYLQGNSPSFTLNYRKGMGDIDYDFLSLKMTHQVQTGWAGKLNYWLEAGSFLNANKLYLMDLKHLNSLPWNGSTPENIYARYRLLETTSPVQITADNYYLYSTNGAYLKAHVINEFRSLLITQLPIARLYGLKEDIFVNYLNSPQKKNYLEVGYGIDGIFKFLRLEATTSFENGKYARWGWQMGVTF